MTSALSVWEVQPLITSILVALAICAKTVHFPGWNSLGKGEDNRFIYRPRKQKGPRIYTTYYESSTNCGGCHPNIRRHIRRHLNQIKHCYEKHALPDTPRLQGRVTPVFWIWRTRVVHAYIESTSLKHRSTEQCILKRIRRIRFSPLAAECAPEIAVVRYPFHFKPKPY